MQLSWRINAVEDKLMDNETLDKVFNFVFGRYAKLYLVPDIWSSGCWPTFTITGVKKAGTGYGDLWVGPSVIVDRGLFTQLRVNILGEDAAKLPDSKLRFTPSCRNSGIDKELLTTASSADPTVLRVKRYIAYGVIKLLERYSGGLAIVEDCDVAHKILDVRSLEELLVKADLST